MSLKKLSLLFLPLAFFSFSACQLDESGLFTTLGSGGGAGSENGTGGVPDGPGTGNGGMAGLGGRGRPFETQDDGSCELAGDEVRCVGEILMSGVVQGGLMDGTCRGGACCLGCWDGATCRYFDDSNCSDGLAVGGRLCAGACPEGTSCQLTRSGRPARVACASATGQ